MVEQGPQEGEGQNSLIMSKYGWGTKKDCLLLYIVDPFI
jgi:hypothetical protein